MSLQTGMIDPKDFINSFSIETLNATADTFFKTIRINNPLIAKGKPFSDLNGVSDTLQNMSHLIAGLRLGKSMTVLDFAAGTCWLSRFLMQLQCKTVSCDVSETALQMGRELFEEFPPPGLNMFAPTFLKFDGYHIELPDECVDRIICHDGFHHVPNQDRVLSELSRVLKTGGIAGFSEPGRFHSQSPESQKDMRDFCVIENDILLPEIFSNARQHGFTDIRIKPICNLDITLGAYEELTSVVRKTRFEDEIMGHIRHLLNYRSLFFLHKGDFLPDSRCSEGLSYLMRTNARQLRLRANEPFDLPLTITNTGSAKWLIESRRNTGVVNIGTYIIDELSPQQRVEGQRYNLPRAVNPGETIERNIRLHFDRPGSYRLIIDLVSERICWFENIGASILELEVKVSAE